MTRMRVMAAAWAVATCGAGAAEAEPIGVLYPQVSVVSDYRYYGVSNSNLEPTAQLSLYLWRPDGLYAGVFSSGVDFLIPDGPSFELDLYAGRNIEMGRTTLTFEGMASLFPDNEAAGPTLNFYQAVGKLSRSHGALTIGAEAAWTPAAPSNAGERWRLQANAGYAAADWLSFEARYGSLDSERGQDRRYWEVGAVASRGPLALDVRYAGTDLEPSECFFTDWCEPGLVGKLTYNLPFGGWGQRR
ncbi:MAG: TorF family putative porin [Maricaulaceae bacterium]|jgi:uncharacterized protein (TIGR02001 family)